MYELHAIRIDRLGHTEAVDFINQQLMRIGTLRTLVTWPDADVDAWRTRLTQLNGQFDESIMKDRKDELTERLKEASAKRIKSIRAYRKQLEVYLLSEDEEEIVAAKALLALLRTSQRLLHLNYEEQTKAMALLLEHLAEKIYADHLAFLSIDRYADRMQSNNNAFVLLYDERAKTTNADKPKEPGKAMSLRKKMMAEYKDFVEYVLAMVKARKETRYVDMLDIINETRREYALLITERAGPKKAVDKKAERLSLEQPGAEELEESLGVDNREN